MSLGELRGPVHWHSLTRSSIVRSSVPWTSCSRPQCWQPRESPLTDEVTRLQRKVPPPAASFLSLLLLCTSLAASAATGVSTTEAAPLRPRDFVALDSIIPDLRVELRYLGSNNFTGRPVAGYEADVAYLTEPAARALQEVQQELAADGLGLKVFDAYRPQRAVDAFMRWAADPDDVAMKSAYYPNVDKRDLIPKGYIAERSGHSRGSTVDLTLVRLSDGRELDMGGTFDYFDPLSWPSSTRVTVAQHRNRMRLREVMMRHGFVPLKEEWWHFTLRDEPYPDTYFDFPVR
jgi:D-alanyl-D-alanine dipeptidase